jgi:hypothetical protein
MTVKRLPNEEDKKDVENIRGSTGTGVVISNRNFF